MLFWLPINGIFKNLNFHSFHSTRYSKILKIPLDIFATKRFVRSSIPSKNCWQYILIKMENTEKPTHVPVRSYTIIKAQLQSSVQFPTSLKSLARLIIHRINAIRRPQRREAATRRQKGALFCAIVVAFIAIPSHSHSLAASPPG